MKKGKLKKILTSTALSVCACAMPFALTGCDKDDDISVRVDGDYVQWQVEGSETWNNLITLDEILDAIGEDIKGDQGVSGIDGKEVEFRSTETHIQWKYVGDDNWIDLISFADLEQKEDIVDEELLNQRGFELFQSKLNKMNSNYKVTYEYADRYVVESFLNYSAYLPRLQNSANPDEWLWDTNLLEMRVSMQYDYSAISSYPALEIGRFKGYTLNVVGESACGKVPTNMLTAKYEYLNEIEEYNLLFSGSGRRCYAEDSFVRDKNFDYEFVQDLKSFTFEDVLKCEFNDEGDCVISFKFTDVNPAYPHLDDKHIYDFYVNKDGEIIRCYVYENGFLNEENRGDLYCKISYDKGESLINLDLLDSVFEDYKEKTLESNPSATLVDWYDVFYYEEQ